MIKYSQALLAVAVGITTLSLFAYLHADDATTTPTKPLIDVTAAGSETQFVPDDQAKGQVSVAHDPAGVALTVAQGISKYPGVVVKPMDGKPWDCSAFGHIEARITNTGKTRTPVVMSVFDSSDGQNSNASVLRLDPGQSGILKVVFGYNYNQKGPSINTAAIDHLLIFAGPAKTAPESFRVETLAAGGAAGETMPVNPATVASRPANGVIFGPGVTLDPQQLAGNDGAKATVGQGGALLNLSFSRPNQSVTVRPLLGMWNLNDQLEVKVKLKNSGQTPVAPSVRLDSKRGNSDAVAAKTPLAPGAETEITVTFQAATPWQGISVDAQNILEGKKEWGGNPGTGTPYYANVTTGITVLNSDAGDLQIMSIIAGMPKYDAPSWLGQKPPVDGDWVKTFEDNFDGDAIDFKKWNIYMPGGYHIGKYNHFSRDNVIVKNGTATLRIEKKRGHHDDDSNAEVNDLATGYLDTFGKWSQRYGYFEIKLKLSRIPNMFPAFWLMPDRGINWNGKVKRDSTRDGAMEFDIMETQSVWGPWRHDWGMHWDGYFEYHKSNGSFTQYVTPDSDGFITVGMLWEPGKVTEFDNGKETGSWKNPRVGSQQEYMIIDNVTGGWENEPLDMTQLPGDLVIKYVRCWQRKDLASPDDGPKANDGSPYAPGKGPEPAPVTTSAP